MKWLFYFLIAFAPCRDAWSLNLSDLLTQTRLYVHDTNVAAPSLSAPL